MRAVTVGGSGPSTAASHSVAGTAASFCAREAARLRRLVPGTRLAVEP